MTQSYHVCCTGGIPLLWDSAIGMVSRDWSALITYERRLSKNHSFCIRVYRCFASPVSHTDAKVFHPSGSDWIKFDTDAEVSKVIYISKEYEHLRRERPCKTHASNQRFCSGERFHDSLATQEKKKREGDRNWQETIFPQRSIEIAPSQKSKWVPRHSLVENLTPVLQLFTE